MKFVCYILSFLIFIFALWQAYGAYSNKQYENIETIFLGSHNNIKFQIHKEYTKASVPINGVSISNANGKFSTLANYIFGGNTESTSISMTAPVLYDFNNNSTFSFVMPSHYKQNNLPSPNTEEIFFKTEYNQCIASIQFGGFANDKICQIKYNELKEILVSLKISFNENFTLAVYNSPYQLINRKNEIWIEVKKEEVFKNLNN